jgi:transcriptional regulator with GAF, ATPase, and Fis domain
MSNNLFKDTLTGKDKRHGNRRQDDRDLREALAEHLHFEKLITRLSATFVNIATDKVVSAIDDALGEVSGFLESDFSTLIVTDPVTGVMQHSHQWIAPHVDTDIDFINFDLERDAPWIALELKKGNPIVINHASELPEHAAHERAIMQNLGIKSIVFVPFCLEGNVAGTIVLNRFNSELVWPTILIPSLKMIGEILANALARKHNSEELHSRLRFEELLSRLSAEFIDVSSESLDEKINNVLREVGEYVNCDEIFLVQLESLINDPGVTHSWFRDGEVREINFDIQQFPKLFPWAGARVKRGDSIIFGSLAELPPEAAAERANLEIEGISSSLVVPFLRNEHLLGLFFADNFRQQPWSDHLVRQIQLLVQIFFNALQRDAAARELQAALTEIGQLKDQLEMENIMLQQEIEILSPHEEIVGESPVLKSVISQAEQVAPLESIVLIQGETGSGKELIANLIHRESTRAHRKMVRVNCASLPATLIEAELFGREKGAYTGALSKQIGRFELADGSTLFLDEIGELPLELQAKLLRVLQDGEFERLGSTRTLKVDVRLIAATNRELSVMVTEGNFREDLYYRLNVFPIVVPPLRERRADIPALVWSFVREYGETMGKSVDRISKSTMQHLQAYDWPGNVRELRNVIERSMILSRGGTLVVSLSEVESEQLADQTLAEVDRHHILSLLEQTGWRIRGAGGAAQALGLNPSTLESRMKKLGIKRTTR